MKNERTRVKALSLLLFFSVLCSCSTGPAQLFPNRAVPWDRVPTVVIASREGDWRIQLVIEAVDFWNKKLSEIGSSFRLGTVTFTNQIVPASELARRSDAVLSSRPIREPSESLANIDGDLIVVLSDGNFVSFAGPFLTDGRRLVGIRTGAFYPLNQPNVMRNVIAHELGHAIGLGHNDDPSMLMCGRPAGCRPDSYRSGTERYFPLMEEEKQFLLTLYPPTWK